MRSSGPLAIVVPTIVALFVAACGQTDAIFPIPDEVSIGVDERTTVPVLANDYSTGAVRLASVEPLDANTASATASGNLVEITLHEATTTSVLYSIEGPGGIKTSHIVVNPRIEADPTPNLSPTRQTSPTPDLSPTSQASPTPLTIPPTVTPPPRPTSVPPTSTPQPSATSIPMPPTATPVPPAPTSLPAVRDFAVSASTTGQEAVGFVTAISAGDAPLGPISWHFNRHDIWIMSGQNACDLGLEPGQRCDAYFEYSVPTTYTAAEQVYAFTGVVDGLDRNALLSLHYPIPEVSRFWVTGDESADPGQITVTVFNDDYYDATITIIPPGLVSTHCDAASRSSCELTWSSISPCGDVTIKAAGYGPELHWGPAGDCGAP